MKMLIIPMFALLASVAFANDVRNTKTTREPMVAKKATTIAVYGNRQGVGLQGGMQTEGRWEMRFNAHGDRSLFYVPIK